MASRSDTNPSPMQIAIRKAIADVNTIEIRTKLQQLNLSRLTGLLFDKIIWDRHDFGPWSKRWVWLDGHGDSILEETDTTLLFATYYYVRGNRKLGSSVPVMLELKAEKNKLNYMLKVDRVGGECNLVDVALNQGNLRGEWIWRYDVSGFVDLPI